MPTKRRNTNRGRSAPKRAAKPESVFLNIPYDNAFENLFLAYISAISAFGFTPRATLEIRSSQRRLERILNLIRSCEFSVHDLSRVEVDRTRPVTPRFNMPFELGLAVALEKLDVPNHKWIVCETTRYRLNKSLGDLDGTDPNIHKGTIQGVFREMCSAFLRAGRQPNVKQMQLIYRILRADFSSILKDSGAEDPFNARVFKDLSTLASAAADDLVPR